MNPDAVGLTIVAAFSFVVGFILAKIWDAASWR